MKNRSVEEFLTMKEDLSLSEAKGMAIESIIKQKGICLSKEEIEDQMYWDMHNIWSYIDGGNHEERV